MFIRSCNSKPMSCNISQTFAILILFYRNTYIHLLYLLYFFLFFFYVFSIFWSFQFFFVYNTLYMVFCFLHFSHHASISINGNSMLTYIIDIIVWHPFVELLSLESFFFFTMSFLHYLHIIIATAFHSSALT